MSDAAPMPNGEPGRPVRRRRWVPWLLGISLCLNLLLVAAAAGFALRGWGPPPSELPAGFDRATLWRVYKSLPDEAQEDAKAALRDARAQFRELGRERAEMRRELADAVEDENATEGSLAAALAAARLREQESRDLVDDVFAKFAASQSAETRREIAEQLRRVRRRRFHDHD